MAEKIARRFEPDRIILFGSWARGNPGPDSDVDLFIVKETDNTRRLAMEIDDMLFPRRFPIDVIVQRPAAVEARRKDGDSFINEILAEGKVLYDKAA